MEIPSCLRSPHKCVTAVRNNYKNMTFIGVSIILFPVWGRWENLYQYLLNYTRRAGELKKIFIFFISLSGGK